MMLLLRLLHLLLGMLICCQYHSADSKRIGNYSSTSASATQSGQEHGNASYHRNLPCPNAEDIAPCICTYYEDGGDMDLNCDNIADEQELYDVFHANIPFLQFRQLHLDTSSVETLREDVFGDSTFEIVMTYFCDGILKSVDPKAFIKSASTLRVLNLPCNKLSDFPIDTLNQYSALEVLHLDTNPISSFPIIESQTLRELHLSDTQLGTIPAGALYGLLNLEGLWTSHTNVASMPTGLFAHLDKIAYIIMNKMKLVHLESYQFEVKVPYIYIYLQDNKIASVDVDAFIGVQSGLIDLQNNQLTILPQETWRPLVDAGVYLSLGGNDLTCGCDVAWLVLEPNYHEFVEDARCHSGELLFELDPIFFENCNPLENEKVF